MGIKTSDRKKLVEQVWEKVTLEKRQDSTVVGGDLAGSVSGCTVFVNCTVSVKQCWKNKQLQSSLIRAARRCAQRSGKQDSCSA